MNTAQMVKYIILNLKNNLLKCHEISDKWFQFYDAFKALEKREIDADDRKLIKKVLKDCEDSLKKIKAISKSALSGLPKSDAETKYFE